MTGPSTLADGLAAPPGLRPRGRGRLVRLALALLVLLVGGFVGPGHGAASGRIRIAAVASEQLSLPATGAVRVKYQADVQPLPQAGWGLAIWPALPEPVGGFHAVVAALIASPPHGVARDYDPQGPPSETA